MKTVAATASASCFLLFTACGDMSNRTKKTTAGIDSAGMNPDAVGYPNTSSATIRDSFVADSANNTSGPDNAVPRGSAADSAPGTQHRPQR